MYEDASRNDTDQSWVTLDDMEDWCLGYCQTSTLMKYFNKLVDMLFYHAVNVLFSGVYSYCLHIGNDLVLHLPIELLNVLEWME